MRKAIISDFTSDYILNIECYERVLNKFIFYLNTLNRYEQLDILHNLERYTDEKRGK